MDDVAVSVVHFPDVVVDDSPLLFRFFNLLCQCFAKFIACHWLHPLGDHVCLVGDISVDKENPSCPEEE